VHVFYYSNVTKDSSQVRTDQELLEMFSNHVDGKVVHMTITYTDPKDMPISCMSFHLEISEELNIPCTPSIVCPSLAPASQSTQPTSLPSQSTTSQHPPEPSDGSDVDSDDDPDDDPDDGILANPEPQTNMLELMVKKYTFLLLIHMWVAMMWVRKVGPIPGLTLNLMLNMRKRMG
jgi:hypothetical protein